VSKEDIKEKILELRRLGGSISMIAFRLGVPPSFVREIIEKDKNKRNKNKRGNIYKNKEKIEVEKNNEEVEEVNTKYKKLILEVNEWDLHRFMRIKREYEKKLGNVSNEYVFLKLLSVFERKEEIEKKEKILKGVEG